MEQADGAQQAPGPSAQAPGPGPSFQEQVDAVVRQRLEQAFGSVFGKVLTATQRAAEAAEKQAAANKSEGLTKALKLEVWKPQSREEELRGWREWSFQLMTWLVAHDAEFEKDIEGIDVDVTVSHALLSDESAERSQKLFGVLCSYLRGRPLLIVRGQEKERNGLEGFRLLKREMEPKERARSLAIVRQLAGWTFKEGSLHEQLLSFEDAVKGYESSSGKKYPEDLMIATLTGGLKEPLRSQVQLRMSNSTRYNELREWVLQYEAVNAPWSSTLAGKLGSKNQGNDHGPQPMEVDVVKGKNKGKDKGKGKEMKGKKGYGKGQHGKHDSGKSGGKWQQQGSWKGQWSWDNRGQTGKQQQGKGGKGAGKGKPGTCHLCGQPGHWKNECPTKGQGKTVRQVEEAGGSQGVSSNQSAVSTSASAYRTPSTVNRVQTVVSSMLGTPPNCSETAIYDLTELDSEPGEFSLDGPNVMMVSAVEHFALDATDDDGDWTYSPDLLQGPPAEAVVRMVRASPGPKVKVPVVVDSGADISVAPLKFRRSGVPQPSAGVLMQDAQGKRIKEDCTRALKIVTQDLDGNEVTIREKFAIAAVNAVILSLGRLLRSGWRLGHGHVGPEISRDGHHVPIWFRRNTLMLTAAVSAIVAYDFGALPPEAEDAVGRPGWAIMPSGLPLLTLHHVKEVSLESSLWETDDWTHMAMFVRKEPASRKPQPGDVWIQVMNIPTLMFPSRGRALAEIDEELVEFHDVAVLLHVDELPNDLLTNPRELFKEADPDVGMCVPAQGHEDDDDGGGVWAERDIAGKAPEPPDGDDDMLDDVPLNVGTSLHVLKDLCRRAGLPTSGSKAKVLRRLKEHKEVLAKQMATEIAKKMFDESERDPHIPATPVLPSARQQALHAVTHQPFQSWCPACVLGRSRQSPHKEQPAAAPGSGSKEPDPRTMIQIDFFYTFTRERGEVSDEQAPAEDRADGPQEEAPGSGDEAKQDEEKRDHRDQFGLNLVAAESKTGWIAVVPILAKGSSSLKRTTETIVRMAMQIAGADDIVVQSDPEASAKQVVHAVQACRTRLGLTTETRFIPRASHASNGVAEKAISTVRRLALTLKAHLEDRAKIKLSGEFPVFSWIMRHAAFLHNRFFVTSKGLPPYEILNSRVYKDQLVQFGECCVGFHPTKYKGDLQWRKGIWVGVNERNSSHVLLTSEGAFETRSIRRLPEEGQWVAEDIVGAKGLPWDYGGSLRRKRALYTSRAPLLPDTAALAELAKAAGRAVAESIAGTPKPPGDEAASDPPSTSSSSSSSSSSVSQGGVSPRGAGAASGETHGNQQATAAAETRGPSSGQSRSREAAASGETDGNQQATAGRDPGVRFDDQSQQSGPLSVQSQQSGPSPMEVAKSSRGLDEQGPPVTPKRAKLLLDRPAGSSPSASPSSLYPPGFAGVRAVHGDVPMEEMADASAWLDEVGESLWEEVTEESVDGDAGCDGDKPPRVTAEQLAQLDLVSDKHEVERLMKMGVMRRPKPGEDVSQYSRLSTKLVRDWRKRPSWVRRSRLVAREFKSWSPWTQDLFAPASSLSIVHGLMAEAQALGLELATLDVKDAYLNVPQKAPVIIEIDSKIFEEGPAYMAPFILERLLPGQRVAAGEWFGFITEILKDSGLEGFAKEPTLFRSVKPDDQTGLVLHADDGLLASTRSAREELEAKLGQKVVVQFSKPMKQIGDELEFLKRRYVLDENGIVMYAGSKHVEGLLQALGPHIKQRETPADNNFLEPDLTEVLPENKAKVFRECLGRVLYLSHSRADIQFSVCTLAGSMSQPTVGAMRKLMRVAGYLARLPVLGFLIRPAYDRACLNQLTSVALTHGGKVVLESITDADWAGNKASRKSKTSVQIYLGGSLLSSFVRTQKSVALSSGESEFVAAVAGAGELLYVKECLQFLLKDFAEVQAVARSDSAACRGIAQRVGCGRVRHLACGLLWVQESVKRGDFRVGPISGARNPADIGTKPLPGPKLKELLYRAGAVCDDGTRYGEAEAEAADHQQRVRSLVAQSGLGPRMGRQALPVLLVLAQIMAGDGAEMLGGLGLGVASGLFEEMMAATVSAISMWLTTMIFMVGFPLFLGWLARGFWKALRPTAAQCEPEPEDEIVEPNTFDKSTQVNMGRTPEERRWEEEYVERCNFLRGALHEEHQTVLACERELRNLRDQVARLEAERHDPRVLERAPSAVAIATSRGITGDPQREKPNRKAFLVGISYPGTPAYLPHCNQDAEVMRYMLCGPWGGFPDSDENVRVLMDKTGAEESAMPTRENIRAGLSWLVHEAVAGDSLLFFFNGLDV
eukprot:s7793_g2.t1